MTNPSANFTAGETLTLTGARLPPTANATAFTTNPFARLDLNPYAVADPSSPMTGPLANLYVFIASGTTVLNVNLTGPMNVVKSGASPLTVEPITSNTYTGATYAQVGGLLLMAGPGMIAIPGDLIAEDAAITYGNLNAGQIASTSNVTLKGRGSLTLPIFTTPVTNTFASINFVNPGGSSTPTFSLGTPTGSDTVIITAANAITAQNDNFGFTPTISAGSATLTALQLTNAAPVINTLGIGDRISPGVYDTGALADHV